MICTKLLVWARGAKTVRLGSQGKSHDKAPETNIII